MLANIWNVGEGF